MKKFNVQSMLKIYGDIPGREIPPPIPAFSLRGMLSPLLIFPCVACALVVLFAPVDILDRIPLLKILTDWMQLHIPHMNGHAASTKFPQMALLSNSMIVASIPYVAMVALGQSIYNYPYLLQRQRSIGPSPLQQHFIAAFGSIFTIGMVAVMIMLPGDPSWAIGATTERRGFYAFLAFMAPYMTGLVIGGQVLNFRLFVDTFDLR